MSVSQSPAGASVALGATDEPLGLPRSLQQVSDATIWHTHIGPGPRFADEWCDENPRPLGGPR